MDKDDCTPLFLNKWKKEFYYVNNRIQTITGKVYIIDERIGNGGNAVVHKCIDYVTGEEFAVKFQLSLSGKLISRFNNEVQLLKELEHEQLVKYVDHGNCNGKLHNKVNKEIPFLIMTLANKTLKEHLATAGKIEYSEYISQFKGLASALAEVHKKAIHRDIKPENILVSGETWVLSDFGLCKIIDKAETEDLTNINENIGPKYWMSPEALNRTIGNQDEIQKCSDIYQICSVFWYIVTRRHPAGIVTREDWSGPEELFQVIYNSLSHDPAKRACDGEELYKQLFDITIGAYQDDASA